MKRLIKKTYYNVLVQGVFRINIRKLSFLFVVNEVTSNYNAVLLFLFLNLSEQPFIYGIIMNIHNIYESIYSI
jgi:hypothetical protein